MPGPGSTSRQCSSCCMSFNVACKTCKFCKAVQPRKLRLNKKMEKFDTKANTWVQAQKRNRKEEEKKAKPSEEQLEDAIFHADLLCKQLKEEEDRARVACMTTLLKEEEDRARAASSWSRIRWVGKDVQGCPLKRRDRSGATCRRTKARTVAINSPVTVEPAGATSAVPPQLFDEIQQLQELLVDQPSTSSSWCLRQSAAQLEWQKARSHHLDSLLSSTMVPERRCSHCSAPAVLRCRECMPLEWLCHDCDISKHSIHTLHNRESFNEGYFKCIPPTMSLFKTNDMFTLRHQDRLLPTGRPSHSCNPEGVTESIGRPVIFVCINGRYDLHLPKRVCNTCHYEWTPDWGDLIRSGYWPASVNGDTLYSTDVFKSFEDLKTVAPGLSRQAFLQMLERRTQHYGRTGKIHGDVFQRSFLEYMACQYECQKMTCEELFSCPACTPKMLAVSVDGNRKQYRFRLSQRIDEPLFKGPFIMEDSAVTDFVDKVRTNVKCTPGKGTCGTSQWSATRETARRASRLDEEGLEVAVCRHGVLLKALNMFRGEIFAYPLFLQTQFQATNVHFYCTDIACKYWPYLEKVAKTMPELRPLLSMQPFLSVMHAKAHSTKCEIVWSGRNLEGAGSTAGEEVEMVNSFLSRCAITTKYMTKSARNDMLTVHAMGWNRRKQENLHVVLAKRYVKNHNVGG
ncbi:uncharacterized protein LOC117561328 isoform X3 [Gymnodraco acuticeps]|uniref:Uncharacterized protein LOC117561328 isoform X3 n=1 Tax=Gymnodraco acuticeps TaxID=8218 RepID=A0A6P8X3K6_GYMAC|nr:uncharacterized protein LOC117561328 isoform X3 [Gymnodraco acuticeps]